MLIHLLSAAEVADLDGNAFKIEKMLQRLQKQRDHSPFIEINAKIPLSQYKVYATLGFARGVLTAAYGAKQVNVYAWPGLYRKTNKQDIFAPEFEQVPIHPVYLPGSQQSIDVLRLDLLHPLVMGNKWFKLKENLKGLQSSHKQELLTFGGAYSNHLFATAAVGRLLGITTRAVVRGEPVSNPVLDTARANGLQCEFWSRSHYRQKETEFEALAQRFPRALIVPEGGANAAGIQGAKTIWEHWPLQSHYRHLFSACGTGSTLAGLILGCPKPRDFAIHGVSVLKGDFLISAVQEQLAAAQHNGDHSGPLPPWQIHTDFHSGGYARCKAPLKHFLAAFSAANPGFPVEHVYTGKLFWAIDRLLAEGAAPPAEEILALHSGGVYA